MAALGAAPIGYKIGMLPLLVACAPEYDAVARVRQLEGYTWLDVGTVAPGARNVTMAPFFSRGDAAVDVVGVALDGEGFRVEDTVATLSAEDADDDADTLVLPLTFLPDEEAPYVATLSVWSNDNVNVARSVAPDGTEAAVWTTRVRGIGRPVCAHRWPALLDLGAASPGTEQTGTVHIENCGLSTLVIAGAEGATVREPFPVYVLPGTTATLTVVWSVASSDPWSAELVVVVDDDALADAPIQVVGNTEPEPDLDGDGLSAVAGDCDETRDDVFPGAAETVDGRDNDCDGRVDEGTDAVDDDGDGLRELEDDPTQNDCDDVDPWVHPSAEEMCDDVDNDCDGEVDEDACPAPPDFHTERAAVGCASVAHDAGLVPLLAMFGLRRRGGQRTRPHPSRVALPATPGPAR